MKSKVDVLIGHVARPHGLAPVSNVYASNRRPRTTELDQRRNQNAVNLTAFKKLLPELLKRDSGKFVAFFEGQLAAKNVDRWELLEMLPRNLRPASSLLVRQVIENQEPDLININRPISGE